MAEFLTAQDKRTHYCGTVSEQDIGKTVSVMGWVQRQRDLGALIFIDLRDRTGLLQLAFDDTTAYRARRGPKLFYLWGHSYEFPRDNNWEVIEKFGEIMASRDDVWHATNMEIYDYVTAFTRLVFSLDYSMIYNPSSIDVYVRVFNKYVVAKAGETTIVK